MATCGGCNFQGDVRTEGGGVVVFCHIEKEWHPGGHICERWIKYSQNMSSADRRAIAESILEREDSERRHQENLREQGITRAHQTKLVLFGFMGGIIGGLLLGYVLRIWGLST